MLLEGRHTGLRVREAIDGMDAIEKATSSMTNRVASPVSHAELRNDLCATADTRRSGPSLRRDVTVARRAGVGTEFTT